MRKVYVWFGVCLFSFIIFFFSNSQRLVVSPVSLKESISSVLPVTNTLPPLSLETVFLNTHGESKEIWKDKSWTLVASGDIIPARSVNQQTVKRNDFLWSWKNIIPILSSGDITLINLESPLVSNCPVTVEGMIFCGDQRHIKGLQSAGVTVANFANNHMGNYGLKGIQETKQLLEDNAIKISGLGYPAFVKIQGITVAFLGFDDIGPHVSPIGKADEEEMKKQIIEANNQADVVIVSMSWGVEYTDMPSDRQIFLGHLVIDSGADLIIGNHPHWMQPIELYKGKMIAYAHGNTIFDQMWSEKTKVGVIGKYIFYGKDLVDVEFIPTYIKEYGQPEILSGREKDAILESLQQQSNRMSF